MKAHLGERAAANNIVHATGHVTQQGIVTLDLGGKASTGEVIEAVLAALEAPARVLAPDEKT